MSADEEETTTIPHEASPLLGSAGRTSANIDDEDDEWEDIEPNHTVFERVIDVTVHTLETVQETTVAAVHKVEDVVEHAVEGAQHVVEHAVEAAHDVAENALQEIHDVQETVLEELHEADDGELTFLDMTLTRGLSLLPGELQAAADKLTEKEEEAAALPLAAVEVEGEIPKPPPHVIPISAYVGLASAVVSLSAIGPLLAMQADVSGSMKIFWRMFGTSILLIPFAVTDIKRHGLPVLTTPQWVTFLLSTVSYLIMAVAFVLAIDLTAIGNAVILSNSQAIMLLTGNLLVGAPVSVLEGWGAVTAFAGAVLCSKDSSEDSAGGNRASTLWGDALAVLAGAGGCGYLIFARTARQHMPLFVFTFLTMFVGSAICLLFQVVALSETVSWNMDRSTGVFGFLNLQPDRLPLELVIVVVCNCLGTLGYIRAMQHFDSLIISVAGLMEPVTAEFLAFFFGVSLLPGWKGWLGNILVAGGTLAVVWPTEGKKGTVGH